MLEQVYSRGGHLFLVLVSFGMEGYLLMVETRTGTLTWNYCSEDSRHTRYGQVTISYVSYMAMLNMQGYI